MTAITTSTILVSRQASRGGPGNFAQFTDRLALPAYQAVGLGLGLFSLSLSAVAGAAAL